MDTITITVAENDPDVIVSATLNEDAVTITLNESAVGATGAGVAAGGSANDILKKTSGTNYATEWETPTSAATANTVVRRDETGGAFFGGDVGAPKYRGNFYQAESATDGASLRNSSGTAVLTWGATAGNISITVNTTSTGHFFSNPSTAEAGHFITKNGTTPTLAAGRSAWFSDSSGSPQFKNGTSSAITLIYNGGALGTPSSGTLTSCTGLPISTGVSGLGTNVSYALAINVGTAGSFVVFNGALGTPASGTLTNCTGLPISTGVSDLAPNVASFLMSPGALNFQAMILDYTGTGNVVMENGPVITNINIETAATLNATSYTYGTGAATAHRTALGLTALATTTPGTGVATALAVNVGTAGAFVVNGGALGTPSSGTVTNLTGTASININGTVGATSRNTGAFTTLTANGATTLTAGTASTSNTTGTLVVTGGIGASGAIYTTNRIWANSGGAPVVLGGLSVGDGVYGGLWINQASPSSSNYSFLGQAGQSLFNATSGGTIELRISNSSIMNIGPNGVGIGVGNNIAPTILFEVKATTTRFSVSNAGSISIEKTITAAGTTGAQTINKASGSVNFAASATSLVVTNSLCTTSSVINATIATNDATASGLRVVAGSGSFTIYMLVAPTAETRVNFLLTN